MTSHSANVSLGIKSLHVLRQWQAGGLSPRERLLWLLAVLAVATDPNAGFLL